MRKRIWRSLAAAALTVCLVAGAAGCGASNDNVEADSNDAEEEEYWNEEEGYEGENFEGGDDAETHEVDYEEGSDQEAADSNDYYVEEMGITFHLPDKYYEMIGTVDFYGMDVTQGEGYFYGEMDYTGIEWETYQQKVQDENFTDEDAAEFDSKTVPLFAIMGATSDKAPAQLIEIINAYTESNFSESNLSLITEKDGFCFYRYDINPPKNYDNLDGDYKAEYDSLVSLNDELVQGADYSRPLTAFEQMVGNKISFTTTDIDGNTISSEDIFSQHEITMVNVWATWCGWCVGELGELEQINKDLASNDCAIVGLCGDANDAATVSEAKSILADNGVTYLNICPFDGWEETFEMSGWPTSFFVDRNGNMVTTPISGAKVDEYKSHILDALDGKAPAPVSQKNSYESNDNFYRIIVADNTSAPVEGAMVQFCTADTCKMGMTDSNGTVTFDDPPGEYEVHVRKLPDGYNENNNTYKTESYYSDMVITVEKK